MSRRAPARPEPTTPAEPVRTCVGCRRRAPQRELVRVAVSCDTELQLSRTASGRGAWLCAGSEACLDQAIRRKALDRALRRSVSPAGAVSLRASIHNVSPEAFEPSGRDVEDLKAAGPGSDGKDPTKG